MNFSDYFNQSGGQVKYQTEDGTLVAVAKNFEVHVLDTNSLRMINKFQFSDVVSHLEWSPDNNFLLIGVSKRAQAFVKSMQDPDWQCKIDEGLAGMANCLWAPTSRHVITISDFNVRLTVWSMVDKSVQYIQCPKHSCSGLAFSPNRKIMALLEKSEDNRDLIGLYDLSAALSSKSSGSQAWNCLHQFFPDTFDAQDLKFTQDGNHLLVWESPLKNSLQVYQIVFGQTNVEDIRLLDQFQQSGNCLGLRTLEMTPSKQYVLGGYCDQKMRMISTLSWKEVFAFNHALEQLDDNNSSADVNIYVEAETKEDGPLYEAVSKPFKLERLTQNQIAQVQSSTGLPRVGISKIAISPDSCFAATVNEQHPKIVWIWDLIKMQLNSLILQKDAVLDLKWAPNSLNLNISSSDAKIFLWSLRGASVCLVPPMNQKQSFNVTATVWNPNGKNFAAIENNSGLVFVYPQLQFFQQD